MSAQSGLVCGFFFRHSNNIGRIVHDPGRRLQERLSPRGDLLTRHIEAIVSDAPQQDHDPPLSSGTERRFFAGKTCFRGAGIQCSDFERTQSAAAESVGRRPFTDRTPEQIVAFKTQSRRKPCVARWGLWIKPGRDGPEARDEVACRGSAVWRRRHGSVARGQRRRLHREHLLTGDTRR